MRRLELFHRRVLQRRAGFAQSRQHIQDLRVGALENGGEIGESGLTHRVGGGTQFVQLVIDET